MDANFEPMAMGLMGIYADHSATPHMFPVPEKNIFLALLIVVGIPTEVNYFLFSQSLKNPYLLFFQVQHHSEQLFLLCQAQLRTPEVTDDEP